MNNLNELTDFAGRMARMGCGGDEITKENFFECVKRGIKKNNQLNAIILEDDVLRKELTHHYFIRAFIKVNATANMEKMTRLFKQTA